MWTNGEVLNVSDSGARTSTSTWRSAPPTGPDRTKGLLGRDNGVETDFATADGALINATNNTSITSAQLYGDFANAWRVTDATSLLDYAPGTATADYTFANFPYSPASIADLPADVGGPRPGVSSPPRGSPTPCSPRRRCWTSWSPATPARSPPRRTCSRAA